MADPTGPQFKHAPAQEPPPAVRKDAAASATPPPDDPAAGESFPLIKVVADLWSRVADVDPVVYYWEEPADARKRDGKRSLERSLPLLPTRRPIFKRVEPPPPRAGDDLASVIALLQNLSASGRVAGPEIEGASSADPGQSVLQAKRLTRTGVTPNYFQAGAPLKAWSAPRIEANPEPDTVEEPPPKKPAPPPEVRPAAKSPRPKRRRAGWLVPTAGLFLAALCLLAYLWTRVGSSPRVDVVAESPAPHGKPARAQEVQPSEKALKLTNLALEAIQQGDLKKATGLLDDARKQGAGLSGFFYQAALLAFSQGQSREADDFLSRSIEANEAVADCWYLRANASFFAAGPEKAAGEFAQAVYADPFNPRYYFFRAECLRRNGNTAAALGQFQQALRCRPSSTDTELILFKIGLTRLEASEDLPFRTELRERLSHEPVAGDTLLLAAADAIGRSEYAEAADDLKRAALVLPPRVFQSRVRDYVFQSQAQRPAIAPVLKPAPPAGASGQAAPRAAPVPVDPATRSLAEADPAGW